MGHPGDLLVADLTCMRVPLLALRVLSKEVADTCQVCWVMKRAIEDEPVTWLCGVMARHLPDTHSLLPGANHFPSHLPFQHALHVSSIYAVGPPG